MGQLYDLQDNLSFDRDDLESSIEVITGEIESLRDECDESLMNMPEHLQDTSDSGMMLTERIDALQEWQEELEIIDLEVDEDLTEEEKEERIDEIISELEGGECNI